MKYKKKKKGPLKLSARGEKGKKKELFFLQILNRIKSLS